jgi:hypothetical protein
MISMRFLLAIVLFDTDWWFGVNRKPNSPWFHVKVDPSLRSCNWISKKAFLLYLQDAEKLPGTLQSFC